MLQKGDFVGQVKIWPVQGTQKINCTVYKNSNEQWEGWIVVIFAWNRKLTAEIWDNLKGPQSFSKYG